MATFRFADLRFVQDQFADGRRFRILSVISLAVAAAGWVGVSSPGDYAA